MRVLLVTQYFYPENFKSNDIAFELVKRGYTVDALVSIPNYPQGEYYKGYGVFKKRHEVINGVNVYRVFQTPRGRKASSVGLFLNYLTYAFFASVWAIAFAIFKKKYDAIFVFQTSPITQALPAIVISKLTNTKVFTWVLDVWPEAVLSSSEKINNSHFLKKSLTDLVKFVYKCSYKILISSPMMKENITEKGDYSDKIIYFPNWFVTDDKNDASEKQLPKLLEGIVIMMMGNLGSAQITDELLQTMLLLHDVKQLKWVFVGDGSYKGKLDNFIKTNHLADTAQTVGRYDQSYMHAFANKADIMLLTLNPRFESNKIVVPARLQSYMYYGKPIICLMTESGSTALIKESNCGCCVSDAREFNEVFRNKILPNLTEFKKLGANGKRYFDNHFILNECINHLIEILNL